MSYLKGFVPDCRCMCAFKFDLHIVISQNHLQFYLYVQFVFPLRVLIPKKLAGSVLYKYPHFIYNQLYTNFSFHISLGSVSVRQLGGLQ